MKANVAEKEPQSKQPTLLVGDIAPKCALPDTGGKQHDLLSDSIAGNTIVLFFYPKFSPQVREALQEFRAHLDRFKTAKVRMFAITPVPAKQAEGHEIPFPVLLDPQERVFRDFGANRRDMPTTFVLRSNHHVAAIYEDAPATQGARALAVVEQLASVRKATLMDVHPPVLMIRDVLSREDCAHLINIVKTTGQQFVEPGAGLDYFNGTDYKMRIPEHMREDRIDHWIFNKNVTAMLDHRFQRVYPEIRKAFQYQITKKEAVRIGWYKGHRGGYCHGHRDNIPPWTYRRFAMSINLNTEDFEGGELRFPEFGDQRYRPETGDAIVFSSSVLHEAMHVTAGERYVVLAFLFGDH